MSISDLPVTIVVGVRELGSCEDFVWKEGGMMEGGVGGFIGGPGGQWGRG